MISTGGLTASCGMAATTPMRTAITNTCHRFGTIFFKKSLYKFFVHERWTHLHCADARGDVRRCWALQLAFYTLPGTMFCKAVPPFVCVCASWVSLNRVCMSLAEEGAHNTSRTSKPTNHQPSLFFFHSISSPSSSSSIPSVFSHSSTIFLLDSSSFTVF